MTKTHAGALLPLLMLFCLPLSAQSADLTTQPDYSYAQAGYVPQQRLELAPSAGLTGRSDADGFSANLSYQFVEWSYIFARGDFTDLDTPTGFDGDGDYDAYSVGLGLRGPVIDTRPSDPTYGQMDIYTEFSYESLDADASVKSGTSTNDPTITKLDGDGFGATLGIRWLALPGVEVNPYAGYLEYTHPELTAKIENIQINSPTLSPAFGVINVGTIIGTGRSSDDLNGARYGLRSVFDITSGLSAVVGYERSNLSIGSDDYTSDTVRMSVRWYFPSRGLGATF